MQTLRVVWPEWDPLVKAGASEPGLVRLTWGKTDLGALSAGLRGPGHVPGPGATLFGSGTEGEAWLERILGANGRAVTRQVRFRTDGCLQVCNASNLRVVDALVDGVAHESKVGYRTLAQVEAQIRSDSYLIRTGRLKGAHWHFLPSGITNRLGPSPKVRALLDEVGIRYTVHLPVAER